MSCWWGGDEIVCLCFVYFFLFVWNEGRVGSEAFLRMGWDGWRYGDGVAPSIDRFGRLGKEEREMHYRRFNSPHFALDFSIFSCDTICDKRLVFTFFSCVTNNSIWLDNGCEGGRVHFGVTYLFYVLLLQPTMATAMGYSCGYNQLRPIRNSDGDDHFFLLPFHLFFLFCRARMKAPGQHAQNAASEI